MTVPGNSALLLTLLAVFVAGTGYAAGRLHQRHRTDLERDEAYRDGYDMATRSVFSLAARVIGPWRERAAVRASASVPGRAVGSGPPSPDTTVTSAVVGGPSASSEDALVTGRHTVPDELVRAATYRLTPDRVARAKVREVMAGDLADDATYRLPDGTSRLSVPRPRPS
jgi:hypothetical protein